MLKRSPRILSLLVGAVVIVSAGHAMAQADDPPDYVPGELLIGVGSPQDRDALIRQLERSRQNLRAGNENVAGLVVERSGNSSLKLKVEFSDNVKGRLQTDPRAELALLEELARQFKANNPSVSYAHPNWIVRVDPIEHAAPSLENRL